MTTNAESSPAHGSRMLSDPVDRVSLPALAARGGMGGLLMGLANLVPGISGGTMLLAVGIYPAFIQAIGQITTLRFRRRSIVTLGSVVGAAVLAIVTLAGPVKNLVVEHRWLMYSLFIGLTLGGVPVVWRLIRKAGSGATIAPAVWIAAVCGFSSMALLAWVQAGQAGGSSREGFAVMLAAGTVGAAAMILPGISGGYMLLLLGVYVPLLSAISEAGAALRGGELDIVIAVGMRVILPVGLGVILGVVAISNLLRWLLARWQAPTLGVLLGLLLGAVIGLWPFQEPVPPQPGDRLKGQTIAESNRGTLVFAESGNTVAPEDYPTRRFRPSLMQVGSAAGLILAGFAVTLLVDRFGGSSDAS